MGSYDLVTAADTFPDSAWETATFCGPNGGNCVEVNLGIRGLVGLRDSKPAAGPILVVNDRGWGAFLVAAISGQFVRA